MRTIDNNPFNVQNSKFSLESNLKSNAHFSNLENLLLNDLVERDVKESNYGEVIRLAYISNNNEIHIDEEALYILQRFTSSEISFVGIYGSKGSGKSLLFDKILNLAGNEGSHVIFLSLSIVELLKIMKKGYTLTVFLLEKPMAWMFFYLTASGSN